jgi:putative methyltransferase (TIGR04325 family)
MMHVRLTFRDVMRLATPPVFVHAARRLRSSPASEPTVAYGLAGDYRSWDEAVAASTGYSSEAILEKTRSALLAVKNGDAAYERDSVLFDEIEYAWPLLAGLMWVAARYGGVLNVLDFGGSLGSTYFQNRAFLSALPEVHWNIVEQSRHVAAGKARFQDDHLRFYASIAGLLAETQPNVVLLSGVLQYLEYPFAILDQLLALPCEHVIIDRTPFLSGPADRLCVQTVPPSIYPASYPSWIFSRSRFRSHLHDDWRVVVTFDALDRLAGPPGDVAHEGVVLVRRGNTL